MWVISKAIQGPAWCRGCYVGPKSRQSPRRRPNPVAPTRAAHQNNRAWRSTLRAVPLHASTPAPLRRRRQRQRRRSRAKVFAVAPPPSPPPMWPEPGEGGGKGGGGGRGVATEGSSGSVRHSAAARGPLPETSHPRQRTRVSLSNPSPPPLSTPRLQGPRPPSRARAGPGVELRIETGRRAARNRTPSRHTPGPRREERWRQPPQAAGDKGSGAESAASQPRTTGDEWKPTSTRSRDGRLS